MFLPIKSITIRNFLSFGHGVEEFGLNGLNVIIGPNGSGKSNLIESIGLLHAAPDDVGDFLRQGGGAAEWFWKGGEDPGRIAIDVSGEHDNRRPYRHNFSLALAGSSYEFADESLWIAAKANRLPIKPTFAYEKGLPVIRFASRATVFNRRDVDISQSIVSDEQKIDVDRAVRPVSRLYRSFQVYQARQLNQIQFARRAQPADMPGRTLMANAANLAAVLTRIRSDNETRRAFDYSMKQLYEEYKEIEILPLAGTAQIVLRERSLRTPVPANRLSDGTIRWLGLLSILLDPTPAPLICIEEPETGLHPDIMLELSRLLKVASERTQLIVTTHSDTLVDALSATPEDVIVCEKAEGITTLQRLSSKRLGKWLKNYTLGPLWRRGELGGNRY